MGMIDGDEDESDPESESEDGQQDEDEDENVGNGDLNMKAKVVVPQMLQIFDVHATLQGTMLVVFAKINRFPRSEGVNWAQCM